ncbi:hypothetical protein B0I35DRAFT_416227 [Stachybotrys elegans]|uniref:Uncharacterized protein n=1 Tax=Stachybotrys elegans TaxID=80388 RepID=A0A8K0T348_9HYPO|nr:hypothetical protein B0I35DRAFT_416227 [Stachybotrys elegans]
MGEPGRLMRQTNVGRHSASEPSFTLIGGYGNATLHRLSLDNDLLDEILLAFRLPSQAKDALSSIHGVYGRFISPEDNGDSITFILSTPKSPVREIFCAVRVCRKPGAVLCLLFDAFRPDAEYVASRIRGLGQSTTVKTPLTLLSTVLKACGETSEEERRIADNEILGAEVLTKSTLWNDPNTTVIRQPRDFDEAIGALHLSHNMLLFINHSIKFETDAWRFLRRLYTDESTPSWLKDRTTPHDRQAALDEVDFEITHTVSRSAQVACLVDRVGVQTNLVRATPCFDIPPRCHVHTTAESLRCWRSSLHQPA